MNIYQRLINCKGDIKKINDILESSTHYDGSVFTWEEIANIMHITEHEAWRLHHVAIIKLRRKKKTKQFLDKLKPYTSGIKDDGSFI